MIMFIAYLILTISGLLLFFIANIFTIVKIMDKFGDKLWPPFLFLSIMVIVVGVFLAYLQQYLCGLN